MGDLPSETNVGQRGGKCIFTGHRVAKMMEKDTEIPPSLLPNCVFGHALAGAFLILVGYLLMYLVNFESMLGSWATPFVLMVVVAVMVMILLTVREQEGTLSFGRAFGLAWFGGWLARLGYNLFNLLLFHVLRPDLKAPYVDLVVETSMEAYAMLGLSASANGMSASDLMSLFQEEAEKTLTLWGQVRDGMLSAVWVALFALIVSAILQRRSTSLGLSGKA